MRATWRLGQKRGAKQDLSGKSNQPKLVEVMRRVMAHQCLGVVCLHGAVHRMLNHTVERFHFSESVEEVRAFRLKVQVEVWLRLDGRHGPDVAGRRANGFGQEGSQEERADETRHHTGPTGHRDAAEVQVHEPRTVAEHLGRVHRAPCRSSGRVKPVEGRAEFSD